ncbi:hypothetical protein A9G09_12030 [Gilliamella sp. wkB292]|nr:hypothetical protein A9G09_12030 [Gilliamella apicola]
MTDYTIEDPRYTKAQVCAYVGNLDLSTLDKWIAAKKFPKPDLYLGRQPRWKLSTVNFYLEQKEQEYQEKQKNNQSVRLSI